MNAASVPVLIQQTERKNREKMKDTDQGRVARDVVFKTSEMGQISIAGSIENSPFRKLQNFSNKTCGKSWSIRDLRDAVRRIAKSGACTPPHSAPDFAPDRHF
jgi:hypothetical protein